MRFAMLSGRIAPMPVPPVTVSCPVRKTQIRLRYRRGTLIRNTGLLVWPPAAGAGTGYAIVPAERRPARMMGAAIPLRSHSDFADGRNPVDQEHAHQYQKEYHADLFGIESAELEGHDGNSNEGDEGTGRRGAGAGWD